MKITLIAAIVLSVVMAFFAVQNSQHTQVTFLGWYFDGPLVIILLITFGAGVMTALLAMLPGTLRKSREISKLKSRITDYSSRVEALETRQNAETAQSERQVGQ
jgi:uncharacterized integral membrane protein